MDRKGIILNNQGEIVPQGIVGTYSAQIGNVDLQCKAMILSAHKGEFKEYPTLGVGINDSLFDDDFTELKKQIIEEFEKDNIVNPDIKITKNGTITIL